MGQRPYRNAPEAERVGALLDATIRDDRIVVRLFCLWIFLQCFVYSALPYLRWNLGIGINITPDKLVVVLTLVALAVRRVDLRAESVRNTRSSQTVGVMASLFTTVALASWWLHGADANNAVFGELTRVLNLAFFPTLAFFVARRLRYNRSMLIEMALFFAAVGAYLGVTAFAEHFNVPALVIPKYILDPDVGIQFGRSRGPFANTIGNGGMLLLSFVAASCLSGWSSGSKKQFTLGIAIALVPAIYFTDTRSVWLGLAALTVTFVALRSPLRRPGVTVIGLLLLIFVVGIGSKFSAYQQTLFSRRQSTVDYRLDNYDIAWTAFKNHPLFGLGYGEFQREWAEYADLRNSRRGVGLDDGNHSTLLGILAELGLAGGIPFVSMVAAACFMCFSAYRTFAKPEATFERICAILAIGALEIFVVIGITSDLKTSPTVEYPYVLVRRRHRQHGGSMAATAAERLPLVRVPGAAFGLLARAATR